MALQQIIVSSIYLALVLSVFEYVFFTLFLVPSILKRIRRGMQKAADQLSETANEMDEIERRALVTYVYKCYGVLRYNRDDYLSEEKYTRNLERVQNAVMISGTLAIVAVWTRLRFTDVKTGYPFYVGIAVSLLCIGVFQFVHYLAVSSKFQTLTNDEVLAYALQRVKPLVKASGALNCPERDELEMENLDNE